MRSLDLILTASVMGCTTHRLPPPRPAKPLPSVVRIYTCTSPNMTYERIISDEYYDDAHQKLTNVSMVDIGVDGTLDMFNFDSNGMHYTGDNRTDTAEHVQLWQPLYGLLSKQAIHVTCLDPFSYDGGSNVHYNFSRE